MRISANTKPNALETLAQLNPQGAKALTLFIKRLEKFVRYGVPSGHLPAPMSLEATPELVVFDSGIREKRRLAPDICPSHAIIKKLPIADFIDDPLGTFERTPTEIVELSREVEFKYVVHLGTREVLGLCRFVDLVGRHGWAA